MTGETNHHEPGRRLRRCRRRSRWGSSPAWAALLLLPRPAQCTDPAATRRRRRPAAAAAASRVALAAHSLSSPWAAHARRERERRRGGLQRKEELPVPAGRVDVRRGVSVTLCAKSVMARVVFVGKIKQWSMHPAPPTPLMTNHEFITFKKKPRNHREVDQWASSVSQLWLLASRGGAISMKLVCWQEKSGTLPGFCFFFPVNVQDSVPQVAILAYIHLSISSIQQS